MPDDVACYILGDEEAFFASFERGDYARQWEQDRVSEKARMQALCAGLAAAPLLYDASLD